MHPNTYLKTFWRMDLRPQVFVAMSFSDKYKERYEKVIEPAIRSVSLGSEKLEPYRVDISQSGDSILTSISDGIAHSRLVLADVSSIGNDSVSGDTYRNGNVMYEVGIALASRQPADVLLLRDDHDKFLFDVSTIPHVTIIFSDVENAKLQLSNLLAARLNEQNFVNDARVQLALESLSGEEIQLLKHSDQYGSNTAWGQEVKGLANWYALATARLLDKRVIRVSGEFSNGNPAFSFTPLGLVVKNIVNRDLRIFEVTEDPKESDE